MSAWRTDLERRGQRFEHSRYIQGSPKAGTARPDVCTITRVTATTIFYRTETGMKMKQDRDRFRDSVKRWVEESIEGAGGEVIRN